MKEGFPIETAEYAYAHDLQGSPAFAWWIPHVFRKRDKIISAVRHRVVKKYFKYGHQIPSSIQEAYYLDRKYISQGGEIQLLRK